MDAVATRRPSMVHIADASISRSADIRSLLDSTSRQRLGIYTVNYVADLLKKHFWMFEQQDVVPVIEVSEWCVEYHTKSADIGETLGFGTLPIGHIFEAFVQLHGQRRSGDKRFLFEAFAQSLKTKQVFNIEIEIFGLFAGLSAYALEPQFTLTKGAHILVPK